MTANLDIESIPTHPHNRGIETKKTKKRRDGNKQNIQRGLFNYNAENRKY